jgi:GTPase
MHSVVAIVGRPNVGKSTLFNRLLGKQHAIVGDSPGVTRDRHYQDVRMRGRLVTLVDTGGFDPRDDDPMRLGILRGVQAAIQQAEVVVCVLDALNPPTEGDQHAVELLRRANTKVVYFANRADNPKAEHIASDLYRLGISSLVVGSALHGRNVAELERAIVGLLPPPTPLELKRAAEPEVEEVDEDEEGTEKAEGDVAEAEVLKRPIRVALLGRPNAGKSSLLNHLCGEERSLVDHRPGTTRDPIEAPVQYGGRDYVVIDTAGVRRRAKVQEDIEAASVMRAISAMSGADTVVLLCDGKEGMSEQDAKLLSLATDRGVPVVVGINKVDLLSKEERREAHSNAKTALHFAPFATIIELSVKAQSGIGKLFVAIDRAFAEFTKRIPTAQLNRFLGEVTERTPPPSYKGRTPRVYYLTQVKTAPPLFVAMCSAPKAFPDGYQRFLKNQLQSAFGMNSIPVRLRFRARRRTVKE